MTFNIDYLVPRNDSGCKEMQNTPKENNDSIKSKNRQAYVAPRLTEVGRVSDLTQSNGNDSGSDGGYS